jgi:GT2 family glycosyltransferase
VVLLDVIIVNWNAGDQLDQCVNSVIRHGQSLVGQVIVVDNGSTDGSDDGVANESQVNLIRTGANLGFAKACNLGAAQANNEFLLFLNPDACLYPDSLPKALEFMQKQENERVGICGVQLVDEDGHVDRCCAYFPSPGSLIVHAIGIDRLIPGLGHFMTDWDHATTRRVDQVIGAFFLVRRCVFEELHGFDESFFVYFEEVDFSCRAKQFGWQSVYLADVQAYHAGGGTSEQVKAKRLFYSLRSRILYAFKHFCLFGAVLVLIATLTAEPIARTVLAISRLSWSSLMEIWAAFGMIVRWLPDWFFKGTTR